MSDEKDKGSVGEEEEEEDDFEDGEDDFDPDELADLQKDAEPVVRICLVIVTSRGKKEAVSHGGGAAGELPSSHRLPTACSHWRWTS